ncbi:hypothetical protein CO709_09550 [Burkholderia thailandensis]|nr:hypothetical protein CO709_09550 [Burkholderia thailandensis]
MGRACVTRSGRDADAPPRWSRTPPYQFRAPMCIRIASSLPHRQSLQTFETGWNARGKTAA